MTAPASPANTARAEWQRVVARYEGPDARSAAVQLLTTLVPLAATFYVMFRSLAHPYWATLLLTLPAAGLLVRTFIIMHDCAHRSFLPWPRLNDAVGALTGVLTMTPFARWRRDHARHHASSGDLDRRGHGDIPTLTVREYLARSPGGRLRYRLFRHPAVLIGLGPLHLILLQRFRPKGTPVGGSDWASVWGTNAALVLIWLAVALWLGIPAITRVYLPAIYLAGVAGVWLFYVQHQYETAYWKPHGDWDYATAAIRGSSYLKLPAPLRWLTGSIGLHHVHHLGPRIPNYRLSRCHDENALFHGVTVLTFTQSVRALRLTLWDEDRQRLVSFAEAAWPRRFARGRFRA